MIGSQLLHYKILQKLGEGGMGAVYLASDLHLGRQVAIKVLSAQRMADEESRRRFLHEAKAQAMLSHPNIATFHEVVEHDDTVFIVMEYVDGAPLTRLIQAQELHPDEILDIALQIVAGVKAAHDHGVIHRDIKPDNIMVTSDGRVKITDFGLARWKGASSVTQKGTRLGSTYYMSPEQAETRKVDHRTDIFSLGVVLYELFCRQRPFEGDSEAVVIYHLINQDPQPIARYCRDVPELLEWIVTKCLAKDPNERYQSVAELEADLKRARHELESGKRSASSGSPRWRPERRRHRMVLAVAGLFLVTTIGIWLWPAGRNAMLAALGFSTSGHGMKLAVVPFAGVGDNPPSQASLDGLVETLTSMLSQMEQFHRSLSVIPASDVRRTGVSSVREAREAFGITHAVTGSLQRVGDGLRVTLNLIDARQGTQMRSAVVDERSADISSAQDSTVFELASLVNLELLPFQGATLASSRTNVYKAYDYYLQGRGFCQQYDWATQSFRRSEPAYLDSAIDMFERAVAEDSSYALAYVGLGSTCWRRSRVRFDSAQAQVAMGHTLRALELDDRLAEAWETLGIIHAGSGRYVEAVHDFRRALRLDSLHVTIWLELGDAYESQDSVTAAENTYRQLIAAKPDDIRGYCRLGSLYYQRGHREKGRELLQSVAARQPEGYDAWNRLAFLYYQEGEIDRAGEMWEKSLTYGPSYAAYSNLGSVYFLSSRLREAATLYEKALAIQENDYQLWSNLASAYWQLPDKKDQAEPAYRRAIELGEKERLANPNDGTLLIHLAECYASVADSAHALDLAAQALALLGGDVQVVARAGLIYEQLGKRDLAVEMINKALRLGFPITYLEAQPELGDLLHDPRLARDTAARPNHSEGKMR